MKRLLQAGGDSLERMKAVLQKADTDTRVGACYFLGRLEDRRAVSLLLSVLQDAEQPYEVRWQAAAELALSGRRKLLRPLLSVLQKDPEAGIRAMAAHALGWLGYKGAVSPLIRLIRDSTQDVQVRSEAGMALANIGDPRAIPALVDALNDEHAAVRYWAAYALGQLRASAALPALERLAATDQAKVPGMGTVSQSAAEAIEWLHDPPPPWTVRRTV